MVTYRMTPRTPSAVGPPFSKAYNPMTTEYAQSPMLEPANARFSRRNPGLRNTRRIAVVDSRTFSPSPDTQRPLRRGDITDGRPGALSGRSGGLNGGVNHLHLARGRRIRVDVRCRRANRGVAGDADHPRPV